MSEFLLNGGLALILLGILLVGTFVILLVCHKKEERMVKPLGYFRGNIREE